MAHVEYQIIVRLLPGYVGQSGFSGYSGYSGLGISGYSGESGPPGEPGQPGYSGDSGYSGFSGDNPGSSGYSGYSGSGISGYSGEGIQGMSGYSGYSGSGHSGYSGEHSTIIAVHQVGHGFTIGDVVRIAGTDYYVKGIATTGDEAEIVGVVVKVDGSDDFSYMEYGVWSSPLVPAFPAGSAIFLSDDVEGALSGTEPIIEGHISKPVGLILDPSARMLIMVTRGATIGRGWRGRYTTITKTDDFTLNIDDTGITFVMDSTGYQIFTLPSVGAADLGVWYTLVKRGSGEVDVTASDLDQIADSSPGGSVYNDQVGETYATLTVQLVSETMWAITSKSGTWIAT